MLTITFLPCNQAYVFLFGEQLLGLDDEPMFFPSLADAVAAASRKGIKLGKIA